MADGAQVVQTVEEIEKIATAVRTGYGRPSLYKPEFCTLAYNLALAGKSDEQIAKALGFSYPTIVRWIAKKRDFRLALLRARDLADSEVAKSLFERAKGYSHPAVKIFPPRTADGDPVIVPYVEHYPPDTGAASFWLRNRDPEKWKERTETNVSGQLTLEALVLASLPQPADPPATPAPALRNITPAPTHEALSAPGDPDGIEDLL